MCAIRDHAQADAFSGQVMQMPSLSILECILLCVDNQCSSVYGQGDNLSALSFGLSFIIECSVNLQDCAL